MNKRLLIAQPVARELELFDTNYQESVFCDNPRIQEIIESVLKSDGKKIRPILLFLAAKACGTINDTTYASAITIELLHNASLIHDDVVDESKMRRGRASLNAVYDNKMAILAGDYFLSTALIKSVMTADLRIIADVSSLGRNLAEGELNQLALVKEVILDENEYFAVIKKKTASLLSICMKIGAISVKATENDIASFAQLGEVLGMCFQLRDDIFDYYKTDVGKPTGNDIREGKVTLPLLYVVKNGPKAISDDILRIITADDFTQENIETLIAYAKDNGGIDYTYEVMANYKAKAVALIEKIENAEVRKALEYAVEYIVERAY